MSSKIGSNNYTKIIVVFVGLLLLAGVTVAVDRISGGTLSGRFFRFSEAPVKTGNGITGIETGQDQTRIRIRGYDLYLSWTDYGNPKVRDEQGDLQLLSCSKSDYQKVEQCLKNETIRADITEADVMWVEADEFNPCYLIRISLTGSSGGELDGYAVCDGKDVWLVARDSETGSYKILNRQGRLDGCVISEDALPRTLTGFASERGYIWSKTIARLRSVLLIGTGPDTFPLFFPNDDYVQRHLIGKDDTLVNKPHCWYLQMAAETGLLSAVMLVVFIGSYLFHFLKLESAYLMKKQSGFGGSRFAALSDSARVLNLAIGLSVFSYMIVSLANDSMIVCAPVFWVLLGYGSAYCFNDSNLRRRV